MQTYTHLDNSMLESCKSVSLHLVNFNELFIFTQVVLFNFTLSHYILHCLFENGFWWWKPSHNYVWSCNMDNALLQHINMMVASNLWLFVIKHYYVMSFNFLIQNYNASFICNLKGEICNILCEMLQHNWSLYGLTWNMCFCQRSLCVKLQHNYEEIMWCLFRYHSMVSSSP